MNKYIIELWECVEVEANSSNEAIRKAWKMYDAGDVQITEATELECYEEEA